MDRPAHVGRWITDVVVPRDLFVRDIGRDYLLALVQDELEVERVVRFAISGREDR